MTPIGSPPAAPVAVQCNDALNVTSHWLVLVAHTDHKLDLQAWNCDDFFAQNISRCSRYRWIDADPRSVCCVCGGGTIQHSLVGSSAEAVPSPPPLRPSRSPACPPLWPQLSPAARAPSPPNPSTPPRALGGHDEPSPVFSYPSPTPYPSPPAPNASLLMLQSTTSLSTSSADGSSILLPTSIGVGALVLMLVVALVCGCFRWPRKLCTLFFTHHNPSMGPLYIPEQMRIEYAQALGFTRPPPTVFQLLHRMCCCTPREVHQPVHTRKLDGRTAPVSVSMMAPSPRRSGSRSTGHADPSSLSAPNASHFADSAATAAAVAAAAVNCAHSPNASATQKMSPGRRQRSCYHSNPALRFFYAPTQQGLEHATPSGFELRAASRWPRPEAELVSKERIGVWSSHRSSTSVAQSSSTASSIISAGASSKTARKDGHGSARRTCGTLGYRHVAAAEMSVHSTNRASEKPGNARRPHLEPLPELRDWRYMDSAEELRNIANCSARLQPDSPGDPCNFQNFEEELFRAAACFVQQERRRSREMPSSTATSRSSSPTSLSDTSRSDARSAFSHFSEARSWVSGEQPCSPRASFFSDSQLSITTIGTGTTAPGTREALASLKMLAQTLPPLGSRPPRGALAAAAAQLSTELDDAQMLETEPAELSPHTDEDAGSPPRRWLAARRKPRPGLDPFWPPNVPTEQPAEPPIAETTSTGQPHPATSHVDQLAKEEGSSISGRLCACHRQPWEMPTSGRLSGARAATRRPWEGAVEGCCPPSRSSRAHASELWRGRRSYNPGLSHDPRHTREVATRQKPIPMGGALGRVSSTLPDIGVGASGQAAGARRGSKSSSWVSSSVYSKDIIGAGGERLRIRDVPGIRSVRDPSEQDATPVVHAVRVAPARRLPPIPAGLPPDVIRRA